MMGKNKILILLFSSMLAFLAAFVFYTSSTNPFDLKHISIEEKKKPGRIPLEVFFANDKEEGEVEELNGLYPVFLDSSNQSVPYPYKQIVACESKNNSVSHSFNYYHSGISPPLS